jgi:plastocyanin
LLLAGAAACSSSASTPSGTTGGYGSTGGGGSTTTTSAPAQGGQAAGTITIASFAFTTPLTVAPGATVTVTNTDSAPHTVTADTGSAFDAHAAAGATVTFTAPMTPGTYAYHCSVHPNMHGTLIVK